MRLNEFLHFNSHCPICGNPLNLYMQWMDSICFKAVRSSNDLYKFFLFTGVKKDGDIKDDDYMLLQDKGTDIDISFSSSRMLQESKKFSIYFFLLCNPSGFRMKKWGDYEISIYRGCYYRDTPFFEFEKNPNERKKWILQPKDKSLDIIMKHESYSFKKSNETHEKVYTITLDYEYKKTTFWYYKTTEEERQKEDFEPSALRKEMPLLKTRIKAGIEDRDKLIDRMDSWVLVS